MLTSGACVSINTHASEALKAKYLPNMYAGVWAGSMCLTEAHAGTDLGIIRTKAEPQSDGSYKISGTKIFITGGEHDLAENIIHLVLAKLPDAPAGPKGISLFLVPKIMLNDDGSLAERNTVFCGSIEHKMGIQASATCVMNFDQAEGYLIGEPNKGLAAMFTMMNYERLGVGIQGLASGERSYQNAIEYARDRLQSRAPTGAQSKDTLADPIIVHPVRGTSAGHCQVQRRRSGAPARRRIGCAADARRQGLSYRHGPGHHRSRSTGVRRSWLHPRVGPGAVGA
jgi:hypothetical protein